MASGHITENHVDTNTTTSTDIETANHIREFDLRIVRNAFVNCIQPDNTLLLKEYIRAYEELCV